MRWLIVLALFGLALARPPKRYDGFKVLEIIPKTTEQLNFLLSWQDKFDFWVEPTKVGRFVHLMVGPQHQYFVRAKLLAFGMAHSVHIDDVQRQIDANFDAIEKRRASRPDTFVWDYDNYNTFDDYLAEIENLAANHCPTGFTCTTADIGTTLEGNPLRTLHITRNNAPQPRYTVWWDSMIHAREWLAGATHMKLLQYMIVNYAANPRFLDSYDWYFLPVMNPDGYEYTWADNGDRLWRKNRGETSSPACIGVDLNRNYPFHWSEPGASGQPCSETYYGMSSASELETQAIIAEGERIVAAGETLIVWINYHTYGPYWLTPWGDCTVPADHTTYQLPIANAAADAAEETGGQTWLRGNSCQTLYETSGSIIDDMLDRLSTLRISHTPELRGPSFIVPPDQIQPSFEEVLAAQIAFFDTYESIGLP